MLANIISKALFNNTINMLANIISKQLFNFTYCTVLNIDTNKAKEEG